MPTSTGRVPDPAGWLDRYDRVVVAASRHLPADALEEVAAIGRTQRERRAYAGTVLLVGLAGGTGSGKSSLLNALSGEEVSPSGAMRPTTSKPVAWVPADVVTRVEGLLARFGISDIVGHSLDIPIAIIDLPDLDSREAGHRSAVAQVLPIIDLVVWVLDPEKYRDRVLHVDHIVPLAIHHERFRFVLNQIDRVDPADISALIDDLIGALRADGITHPVVWAAAAEPPSGPPMGVEAIWDALLGEVALRPDFDPSLGRELRRGLDLVSPHIRAIGFGSRWDKVRVVAAGLWASGRKPESLRHLRSFVTELSNEAPGIDEGLDIPLLLGSPTGDAVAVARHLDATLGRLLRDRLRPRATTRALADELALLLPNREHGTDTGPAPSNLSTKTI